MKFSIVTMSYERLSWAQEGISLYTKRLSKYANLNHILIKPKKTFKKLSVSERKEKDIEIFLTHIPDQAKVLICDAQGTQYGSEAFSQFLEKEFLHTPHICFIIGPAYGLSPTLLQKFPKISFSKMTLQHEMIDLLLCEQLYRALTITHNHPYHQ